MNAPGEGASTIVHSTPSHRWIITSEGSSGSPVEPTAHASLGDRAETPSSVTGVSGTFVLGTSSHEDVHVGAGDGESVGEATTGTRLGPPSIEATTAVPMTNVIAAAIPPLMSPFRWRGFMRGQARPWVSGAHRLGALLGPWLGSRRWACTSETWWSWAAGTTG